MSRNLSKIELFKEIDFKSATRLDRLRMCMLDPKWEGRLNDQEFQHLNRLRRCFSLVHDELSPHQAMKKIQADMAHISNFDQAKTLYRDMCELYEGFMGRNKIFARAAMVEKLYGIAKKLEDDDKLEAAAEIYYKAATLEGLDKADTKEFNPNDIKIPQIIITSDPRAIEGQNNSDSFDEAEIDESDDD